MGDHDVGIRRECAGILVTDTAFLALFWEPAMPRERIPTRKIKDVLRLHYEVQLSRTRIGKALGRPRSSPPCSTSLKISSYTGYRMVVSGIMILEMRAVDGLSVLKSMNRARIFGNDSAHITHR